MIHQRFRVLKDAHAHHKGNFLSELPIQVLHCLEARPLAPKVVHDCPLPGAEELHPVVAAAGVPHAEDGDLPVLPHLLDAGVASGAPAHNTKVGGRAGATYLEFKR